MKDRAKEDELIVQLPAPTETLDKVFVDQTVDVPFYENFICSLYYDSETKNLSGAAFPEEILKDAVLNGVTYPDRLKVKTINKHQSCGVMPVYKWLSGTYEQTGTYLDKACDGSDWTIDLTKTSIEENEDGTEVTARCTFKRSFAKGAMREISFDEDIHWTTGYSIYHNDKSVYRYVYGYSYESDKRNLAGSIKAQAIFMNASLAIASLALGVTCLM